ncbi:MAG: SRPBCC domain-containing protein [Candidatus Aenigmarchaeota archaeon]|nr:SRPBCC domain-containing protein [Candidatus Aenigmarchaeota archaeon]
MQITVEKEIVINKPVEQIWKVFVDVNNWPKAFPNITDSKLDGKLEVGKKFRMVLKGTIPFMPLDVQPTVLKMEKNKFISWRGSGKMGINGVHDFIFQNIGKNKTRIVSREVFSGKFVFITRPLKSSVEKSFEIHLQGLKDYIEAK